MHMFGLYDNLRYMKRILATDLANKTKPEVKSFDEFVKEVKDSIATFDPVCR